MFDLFRQPPAPQHQGSAGRAWLIDTAQWRATAGLKPGADATVAAWLATTAGHASIYIELGHLRPLPGHPDATLHIACATHEICVMALNPTQRIAPLVQGRQAPAYREHLFAAQLAEPTDQTAQTRMAATIDLIVSGDLNPLDRPQWIALFGNAMLRPADPAPAASVQ